MSVLTFSQDKEAVNSAGVASLAWSSTNGGASALLLQHLGATLPSASFIASLAFAIANPLNTSKVRGNKESSLSILLTLPISYHLKIM